MRTFLKSLARAPFEFLLALKEILTRPRLLGLCLVPALIGAASFVVFALCSWRCRGVMAGLVVAEPGGLLYRLAEVGALLFSILVSALAAGLVAFALAGFFIEGFISTLLQERLAYSESRRTTRQMLLSLLRGLKDDVVRILFLGMLGLLILICSFFPPLWIIPLIGGAYLLGYNFIDLPLALAEMRFRRRWSLAWDRRSEVLALGVFLMLLFCIPLTGIICIAPAYHMAVQRLAAWPAVRPAAELSAPSLAPGP